MYEATTNVGGRLPEAVLRRSYPWLPKINPLYATGGDYVTNCLLAAIGTDMTLEEARLDPAEDPELLPYYQVPPDGQTPYEQILGMGKGAPVDVTGFPAIVAAMIEAGRGARGMVLVGMRGTDIDHVLNVVHDSNGVVFLDGQRGAEAVLPVEFRSLQFLPTTEGSSRTALAVAPGPSRRGRFLGSPPAATVPPLTQNRRSPVGEAYALARAEFGLPFDYRFTTSHAAALDELRRLAGTTPAGSVNWSTLARRVNLDRRQNPITDFLAAWLPVDLPKLLSAGRLTVDLYGPGFTVEQLTAVRRLADAVWTDPTMKTVVVAQTGRSPGNEVRVDDLYEVIRWFGGFEPREQLTLEDGRALADLVYGRDAAGAVTIEDLRRVWNTAAGVLRAEAAGMVNQAVLAVAELEPALTVPEVAERRAEMEEELRRYSDLAAATWRPSQHARVEAMREALRGLEDRVTDVRAAAAAAVRSQIAERLSELGAGGSRAAALEALHGRVERVGGRPATASRLNELLAVKADADALADAHGTAVPEAAAGPLPVRRLPGRVLFEAAENARRAATLASVQPIPWGEWGHVARVGDVRAGEDRRLAAQAAALLPERLRPAVEERLAAEFARLGSQEAGRRLTSPGGMGVRTSAYGTVVVRLVPGPLTGARGPVYRQPEEVQSVQVGARPSQALDLPQIMTPSTFTDVSDHRSLTPESTNGGLINIATGWRIMPGVGILPTVTGRGSRNFGGYEGAVTAAVQQVWHDRYAYFEVPADRQDPRAGSHWSLTYTDEIGAERNVVEATDVLLAFAEDESPPVASAPATMVTYALPPRPSAVMAEAFHNVLWRVMAIGESFVVADGPEGAAARITSRFTDADTAFKTAVANLFTESMLFAVHKHVLGHGYLSGEFRVNENGEDWAALRMRGRMTSVRQVDRNEGYVQQDARHLFWSGESSAMSGGVSSGLQAALTLPAFTVAGVPVQVGPTGFAGPAGSVNRSLAASLGAGDWRYLGYPSARRVYRLTMNLLADIRSSRPEATGPVTLAVIGYIEVPEREAERFEREVRDVLEGRPLYGRDDDGRMVVPADGRRLTDRTPPLGLLTGRSRGPAVLDVLGGFERVVPTAMRLIDEAFGDTRLATVAGPLTSRQRHRLERALTQRFSTVAGLPYTSQLISHRISFTRLYQAPGGRVRLTARVRSEQGEEWTADRLEWARIDHYPISYSDLGASEEAAAQLNYRAGGHLRLGPLHSALRSVNVAPGQFSYTRSRSAALTARAGVWSSLGFVYEGPVRLFLFGTRYHVEVELTFEPEAAGGGVMAGLFAGLLAPSANDVVRRAAGVLGGLGETGAPARTVRRHDVVPGLLRYTIAEGLSPLSGGHPVPRLLPGRDGLRAAIVGPPPTTSSTTPSWTWTPGTPERIRADDQPLEVLGVADLWKVAAGLLDAAGVPASTYEATLDTTINEDQLIGRMMWGGPVVQASGLVHGGTTANRHAVIALHGQMYDLRGQAGEVRMRETDIMDSEPAVIFTGRQSTSHVLSTSADLSGAMEDGGPFAGWTLRNVTETRINSNEVLSGRWLTQEDRDYRPHRGTMLWDVTVTSWNANAAGTWSVMRDTMRVLVVGGILLLRPVPQPRIERPDGVPARLAPRSIPLLSTSDPLDWPALEHAPDGLNPVLDMVRNVLGAVDERLLHRQWTVVNGRPRTRRTGLPTGLHTILEHNALLGHRDTLLGPGLILHLARSLPGASEQVSLVLRADPLEGQDYAYEDTRARDFALYRLNTQRRVTRRGTTSARTAGANTGTTRIPARGPAVTGTYLEGALEVDHYEQTTTAQGDILRTRDVLTILGDVHAYLGGLRITATVYRDYRPSKALQVFTLGLANPGFALVTSPNAPAPVAVSDHVDVAERVQIPAAILRSQPPAPAPADGRVRRAAAAATPELVLRGAGHAVLPVDAAAILRRDMVPAGVDPAALRVLFDRSIAVFNGTARGSATPEAVMDLMTTTGIPYEAYAALLSRHQVLTSFHLTLGGGHTFPSFVREDGPATDARGELSVQVRFYDPRPLGWVAAGLTSETLHMAENDALDTAGSTFGLSMDGGVTLAPPSGNPSGPVEPAASFGQSHDHGGTAGERIVRPIAFRRRTHYLRVQTGVLVGLRVSAVQERRDIRYGAGESRLWYLMDESLDLLVAPEAALAMRLLHGANGIPTPHGRYLPHVPATPPLPGSPQAAAELNRLRAAYAVPRYGDWYPVAGHYDPAASSIVMTAMRRDPGTGRDTPATVHLDAARFAAWLLDLEDLGDRPVLLVIGGVDRAFAAEVAHLTEHDLLVPAGDVHQDASLRVVGDDGGKGNWLYFPADGDEPLIYGADLDAVLTTQIIITLRGPRASDPPGTMTPGPPVIWSAAIT